MRLPEGERELREHAPPRPAARDHRRIADIMAEGAPRFREIGVFTLPEGFDPTVPWRLELLVQREISARDKSFTTFDLGYSLPARFLEEVQAPAA